MSWFDASGFANIAKSALREAQRTIDKALDIKDDEITASVPSNTPIDPNSEDFFGNWGVSHSGNIIAEPSNEQGPPRLQSSLWGSFTGSFFDAAAANKGEPLSPSIDLDDSLDTAGLNEHFSGSKLVVHQEIEPILEAEDEKMVEIVLEGSEMLGKRDKPSSVQINRLSIVSCDEKNSSESVELITCSSECTTSPDESDLSSSALRQTSDSVEILVDSLTSPSSIEMLAFDDFSSPINSPLIEETPVVVPSTEKSSPESVEIIQVEDQEEDTMSYTSISESTSATVLDHFAKQPQKMLKDTYESDISLSPDKSSRFENTEAITRAPSRLHLSLSQPNQTLIDTQPQSSRKDLVNLLKNTNIIDIPQEVDQLQVISSSSESNLIESSCDESSQSDRTIVAGGMDSSSDTTTSTTEPTNQEFLKNLIADAMSEKTDDASVKSLHFLDLTQSMIDSSSSEAGNVLENISISQLEMVPSPPRQVSPLSSERESDLVKISSASSGHTSGDELETTTSSDIEIISSPNGDSSSTQSRQSPAKLTTHSAQSALLGKDKKKELLCKMTLKKAKGHNRELSEASSVSDDSHYSSDGMDRLVKRMAEMTEILESRESKLIDMNRRNAELQELNLSLKQQLESVLTRELHSADLSQVTEEYTQRLSALEKKFQQAIREKDTLRKQLEVSKQEAATRMSRTELEGLISEKDETIKELREEGEKLSKQQLQHSNIIKKLRAKEKENEACIKHLKETMEDLSLEMDRLKRSLAAKEEVERSQIEAVHQLTAKNKKIDSELAKLQSVHEDLSQKYETSKKSLEAAKKELLDKNRTSSELIAREHKLETLENEKRETESQNIAILGELEDLRVKLRQLESDYVKKEQGLRQANVELLRRVEEAEARNEELLSQSVLEVSKPLVRQLDSLQATHTLKIGHFEKIEQELTLKINELQGRLQSSLNSERLVKDESVVLRSKVSDLECEQGSLKHKYEMVKMELEQYKTQKQLAESELNSEISQLRDELRAEKEKNEQVVSQLQNQLLLVNSEKTSSVNEVGTERKKSVQETFERSSPTAGSNSPTLSLGKAESVASSSFWWSQDELFEGGGGGGGPPPRYTNMFEMQMLQSNLKQRDGEVQQLQWELNRREQERSLLNSEISALLTRVDDLEVRVKENDGVKVQLGELQQQYDTLCQLFGEKVEENEELKLDLQDVKDMYKSQIDELLKQQKQQL